MNIVQRPGGWQLGRGGPRAQMGRLLCLREGRGSHWNRSGGGKEDAHMGECVAPRI